MTHTPILFLIFNRPDTTKLVFEQIRIAQPKQLFIAADGPRERKVGEKEVCLKTREIATQVNWDCEVKTLFRDSNLGCGKAVSEGISWFFSQVDEGIILEDDCLPNQSFFFFCSELLEKYRDDQRIMHISGSALFQNRESHDSYFFSDHSLVWGWASWKRAWLNYDFSLEDIVWYKKILQKTFKRRNELLFWENVLNNIRTKKIDTWDYQWNFSIWSKNGLCVNSNHNFISNIGFTSEATHTSGQGDLSGLPTVQLAEIAHPRSQKIDMYADKVISGLHGISMDSNFIDFIKRGSRWLKRLLSSYLGK